MRRFSRVNRVFSFFQVARFIAMSPMVGMEQASKKSLQRASDEDDNRGGTMKRERKRKKVFRVPKLRNRSEPGEQKDHGWAESSTRSPLTRRRWQTIGAQEAEPDLWAGREGCVSSRTQAFCTCTYLLIRVYIYPSLNPSPLLSTPLNLCALQPG